MLPRCPALCHLPSIPISHGNTVAREIVGASGEQMARRVPARQGGPAHRPAGRFHALCGAACRVERGSSEACVHSLVAGAGRVTCYVTCSGRAGTRNGSAEGARKQVARALAGAVLFPAHDTRYVTRNAPRAARPHAARSRGACHEHRANRMPQGLAGAMPDFGGVCAPARQRAGIPIAPSPSPPHAADKRVARPSD